MTLKKMVNGKEIILSSQEEADVRAEWFTNKINQDKEITKMNSFNDQIENEKSDMPTWNQVQSAIENAFTSTAQANIIKKIARPVYTILKKTVD